MILGWNDAIEMDAPACAKQVQTLMGLVIWFPTMAIACTSLRYLVAM